MLDKRQLNSMRDTEITKIDRQTLVDIGNIRVDPSQLAEQKMGSYFRQVKNPYCFLCGDTPVRIRFVSESRTLAQSLGDYFQGLK